MKTRFFIPAAALLAVIGMLLACENLVTDLPTTDVDQYISGNTVTFPKVRRP